MNYMVKTGIVPTIMDKIPNMKTLQITRITTMRATTMDTIMITAMETMVTTTETMVTTTETTMTMMTAMMTCQKLMHGH